jgi:hypothetical protein
MSFGLSDQENKMNWACSMRGNVVNEKTSWQKILTETDNTGDIDVGRILILTRVLVTQNYNFACRSVWVRNLVFNIKGGT